MSIYIVYYNYQEMFVTTIEDEHKMLDKHFNSITDREKQDFTRIVKDTESIRCYLGGRGPIWDDIDLLKVG
jgi:hypothetical protein